MRRSRALGGGGGGWYAEDCFLKPNGFSPPLIYYLSKHHLSYTPPLFFVAVLTDGEPSVVPYRLTQWDSSTLAYFQRSCSCCPALFSANFGPLATYCVHTAGPSAVGPPYPDFVISFSLSSPLTRMLPPCPSATLNSILLPCAAPLCCSSPECLLPLGNLIELFFYQFIIRYSVWFSHYKSAVSLLGGPR